MTKRNGLIIALVVLAVIMAVAVTVTGVSLSMTTNTLGQYKTQLEYVYERNFYELTDNVNNIESNLGKLKVCTDAEVQERYLGKIVALSNATQSNISTLPIEHNAINETIKFTNQLSGYALVLQQNLAKGEELTLDDFDQIENMHQSSQSIKYELNRLSVMISGGYSIVDNIADPNQTSSNFNNEFSGLSNEILEYPQLIYDGPFSESTTNQEIKGLPAEEINREEALANMKKWFEGFSIEENGETTGGSFDTYDFSLSKGEVEFFAQVTKRGGILLQLNGGYEVGEATKSEDECRTIAQEFAKHLGFENCNAVWSTISQGFAYVNLTPIINDVIIYPDLIKVKVAVDTGMATGWEARSWAYNHTERSQMSAAISAAEAAKNVPDGMDVRTTKLCIIPNEYVGESLCYEFMCIYEGATYYVYVNANTGLQSNILKVIETDDGNLLM